MKPLTTFLIAVLSCSFALVGSQTFAQDTDGDSANFASDQLEETILQLREQLMKLERERATVPASLVGAIAKPISLNSVRSGNGAFDQSQMIDAVPAQVPAGNYSAIGQEGLSHQQAMPMSTPLQSNSNWLSQPVPAQSVPMAIPSQVQPIYAAPVIDYYSQPAPIAEQPVIGQQAPAPIVQQPMIVQQAPAPIVQQPVFVQQAPAPQVAPTIIVNIYQQAPAARNNYFPPILAPVYGPAPIQVSSPRRGCCLFGRR